MAEICKFKIALRLYVYASGNKIIVHGRRIRAKQGVEFRRKPRLAFVAIRLPRWYQKTDHRFECTVQKLSGFTRKTIQRRWFRMDQLFGPSKCRNVLHPQRK